MISAFQHFSLSAFFLLLVGCSPSLVDAKQVLQQQITSQSKGHIKLVSFRKTDLQEFQVQGVPGRRIRYAAQIEFEENGLWSRGVGNESLNFAFSANPRTTEGYSASNPRAAKGGAAEVIAAEMIKDFQGERQMSEGDRIKIVGVMTGTKSENGWRYELNENRITD